MSYIIQSNRERKSRLDEGLVERLNSGIVENMPKPATPKSTSNLRFITDEKEYEEIIRFMDAEFPDHKPGLSGVVKYEDGAMKGSNVYVAIAVNRYLRSIFSDYRIATLDHLQENLEFIKGVYVDIGLAIRGYNQYLVGDIQDNSIQSLLKNIKKDGILEDSLPIWINLNTLHLNKDMSIDVLKAQYIRTDSIKWPDETYFEKTDKFGLPTEPIRLGDQQFSTSNNLRKIYTSISPLSRCMIDSESNLATKLITFAYSSDAYRIVLAKL